MTIFNYILTGVCSIFAWLLANYTVFPFIIDWWRGIKKEKKQEKIDAASEVLEIKDAAMEVSEKQFTVLLNQITSLEEELQNYAAELQKLRTTILRLNAKLYDKSLLITELQKKCCEDLECPNRKHCKNYLCGMVGENNDEND